MFSLFLCPPHPFSLTHSYTYTFLCFICFNRCNFLPIKDDIFLPLFFLTFIFSSYSHYSIKHWPKNIDPIILRDELARALKVWSDVSKLTFTETRSSDADIVVSFRSGKHGDDYAFDGPGNILAHAFFPMKGSPIGGDAHFDADEKWVKNSQLTEGNVIYDNDPNSADG